MYFVENKEVVFPGTLLTDNNMNIGNGTFKDDGKIFSSIMGFVYFNSDNVSVIPFKDSYKPKYGDLVIGRVTNSSYSSWAIDLNTTYHGYLPTSELYDNNQQSICSIINDNDILLLRVANVDEINRIKLTIRSQGLGKFNQGVIKKVNQPTIHFLSEENIFIISLIEKYLHSDVIVAKNGLIWINAQKENIQRVVEIIEFIDENPFMHNLVKKVQSIIINPRGNLSE
ncbi:MAG: hypothetical protein BZ133_07095 [Methanosphaera sp. SHI613]|jgi:exosome complex component RRP4|nr:MAG: hypothetical protein BZ133_07095 [Methanosphaera sp. SHI613]